MKEFPYFMKNPRNRIKQSSQYTNDIEGYVFDGVDGSQAAFWTCYEDRKSSEHVVMNAKQNFTCNSSNNHNYDQYLQRVQT